MRAGAEPRLPPRRLGELDSEQSQIVRSMRAGAEPRLPLALRRCGGQSQEVS